MRLTHRCPPDRCATVALAYLVVARGAADRGHPVAHLRARASARSSPRSRTPAAISALQPVAAHRRDRGAAQRRLRRRHGAGPGPRPVPRARPAAGRRRPALRGVADRRRRLADPAVGRAAAGSAASRPLGFKVIFGLPGMVLATIFVTLPFVVREVEPVLHEIGDEQEQAAATLGASGWQTFWRITLPGHPLGPDLRHRAHRRPVARRVRRRDHGVLRLPRGVPDPHPARALAATSTTTTPTAPTARPPC